MYFKIKDSTTFTLPDYDTSFSGNYPYLQQIIDSSQVYKITRPFTGINSSLNRVYKLHYHNDDFSNQLPEHLLSISFVDYVEFCPRYYSQNISNDTLAHLQWYLNSAKIPDTWTMSEGENVVIAVIDDAIDIDHPDIRSNIYSNSDEISGIPGIDDDGNGFIDDFHGWNAARENNNPKPATLDFSHGTAVAAVAAASANDTTGIAGTAPKARILPIKCTDTIACPPDQDPGCYTIIQNYDEGIYYAILNYPDVINMSWGSRTYSITEHLLLKAADSMGILLVAAAGNANDHVQGIYPASLDEVISVAALDSFDKKAGFSNFGETIGVDLAAPGVAIIAPDINGNSYSFWNGTSFSSPIVAGICALIKSEKPSYNSHQIRTCLLESTSDLSQTDPLYSSELGYGKADALKATTCQRNYNASIRIRGGFVQCVNDSIHFQLTRSLPGVSYVWVFSDSSSIVTTTDSVKVLFHLPGNYSVQVKILENDSLVQTINQAGKFTLQTCADDALTGPGEWRFGKGVQLSFGSTNPTIGKKNHYFQGGTTVVETAQVFPAGFENYSNQSFKYINTSNDDLYLVDTTRLTKSVQGALALPHPSDQDKIIYILTAQFPQGTGHSPYKGLRTVIVDDAYNHVVYTVREGPVAAEKIKDGELLTSSLISAINTCENQTFVIVHGSPDDPDTLMASSFFVYELKSAAHDSLLLEFKGTFPSGMANGNSYLKVSPNGKRLALCSGFETINAYKTEVFRFELPWNIQPLITLTDGHMHCSFSPNNRFLYVYSLQDSAIYQYDLEDSLPETSRQIVAGDLFDVTGMQLGPDDKIYVEGTHYEYEMLSVISNPNERNSSNNEVLFSLNSIALDSPLVAMWGLPNVVDAMRLPEADVKISCIPTICGDVELSVDSLDCAWDSIDWFLAGEHIRAHTSQMVLMHTPGMGYYKGRIKLGRLEIPFEVDLSLKIHSTASTIIPGFSEAISLERPISVSGATYNWFRNGYLLPDTGATLVVNMPGEYWLELFSTCGNARSNRLFVELSDSAINTNYYAASSYQFMPGPPVYIDSVTGGAPNAYRLGSEVIIPQNAVVHASNTHFILDSGARIIVEPGGYFNVQGCTFYATQYWNGIEVRGDSNSGTNRGIPSTIHGSLNLFHSDLSNALCAVYSKNGGLLNCSGNTASNNKKHLFIGKYSYPHQAIIQNNTFGNCAFFTGAYSALAHQAIDPAQKALVHCNVQDAQGVIYTDNRHTMYDFVPKPSLRDYTHTGIGVQGKYNPAKAVSVDDNTFFRSEITTAVWVENTDSVSVSGNTFGENLPVVKSFSGSNDGVIVREGANTKLTGNLFNQCDNGVQVYMDNSVSADTVKLYENNFISCSYGLVVAQEKHPVNSDTNANNSANLIELIFRCNYFDGCDIAVVGDSNMTDQGWPLSLPFDNTYYQNINWDVVLAKDADVPYFGISDVNVDPMLSQDSVLINGRKSITSFPTPPSGVVGNPCGSLLKVIPEKEVVTKDTINIPETSYHHNIRFQVHLSPNPFGDELLCVIETKDSVLEYSLQLYSMHGQLLLSSEILDKSVSVNTRQLSSGLYLVAVKNSKGGIKTFKLIKI